LQDADSPGKKHFEVKIRLKTGKTFSFENIYLQMKRILTVQVAGVRRLTMPAK